MAHWLQSGICTSLWFLFSSNSNLSPVFMTTRGIALQHFFRSQLLNPVHVSRSDWLIRTIHSPMGFTLTLVCLFTLYLGSFFECLENRDLENGDNRQQTWKTQTSKTKHRSWKGSKHCLCTNWEVSFFTKSIGESILKRAQNYHRDGFKFIDKLSLPETSNLTDADRSQTPLIVLAALVCSTSSTKEDGISSSEIFVPIKIKQRK